MKSNNNDPNIDNIIMEVEKLSWKGSEVNAKKIIALIGISLRKAMKEIKVAGLRYPDEAKLQVKQEMALRLFTAATYGMDKQRRKKNWKSVCEYGKLLNYLEPLVSSVSSINEGVLEYPSSCEGERITLVHSDKYSVIRNSPLWHFLSDANFKSTHSITKEDLPTVKVIVQPGKVVFEKIPNDYYYIDNK